MQRTQITTPAGHKAILNCSYEQSNTYVRICMGGTEVSRRSDIANDIGLVKQAMTTFDDLITNLRDYSPVIIEEDDKGCCCIADEMD